VITVNLCGGAGNQLFQYALGRSLESLQNSVQYSVGQFDLDPARCYLLDSFGLSISIVKHSSGTILHEGSLQFKPEILRTYPEDITLNGFWQSEKYFERVQQRIRGEVFSDMKMGLQTLAVRDIIISQPNSAFLHVRRSDSLAARALCYHGLIGLDYYLAAAEHIRSQVPDVRFFVFSDEPQWCEHNFPGMTVVKHNGWSGTVNEWGIITKQPGGMEHEDMYLMSLCRHAVVSNSTFGWWGAWLNAKEGQERVVVAPKTWFLPEANGADSTDIVPERWARL
jgi:hypothetical protein